MSRNHYSDYVRHALRFYTRNAAINRFRSEADENNWYACDMVITNLPHPWREIITDIYSGYDTIADNVYTASQEYTIDQNLIWDMVRAIEREIAQKRGLI